MKKTVSMILAILMLTCSVALAEGSVPITPVDLGEIELNFEPTWVAFENDLQMAIPSDWAEMEVSEEIAATGVFYLAKNPEATLVVGLAYAQIGLTELDSLAPTLAALYPSLGVIVANGVSMIAYDDETAGYSALLTVDGLGGMYMLTFAPVVEDEALTMTAIAMMTSLGPVEGAEATADATAAPAN